MERPEAAVADAGPLIHLDELGALELLDRSELVAGVLADLRDRLGPSSVREPRVRYRKTPAKRRARR